ncbi:MAG: hypothetical protein CMJ49_04740 [Planctomycetaceae bacterium]|nr:hypothetical protein [Planctomycetaceae bacterium]
MLRQLWTVTRGTFTESIRQPIFLVMMMVCLIWLVMLMKLSQFSMDPWSDDDRLMVNQGLSALGFFGLLLACFTSAGVLSREIDNKTVLTVISKPIGRPIFVAGKFLGVAAAIALVFWVWLIALLMLVRHGVVATGSDQTDWVVITFATGALAVAAAISVWGNYFYNWVFTSTFIIATAVAAPIAYLLILLINDKWEFQSIATEFTQENIVITQVVIASALVLEGLLILTAVAVACSTRLGVVMTLLITAAVAGLGLCSDYMVGGTAERSLWLDSGTVSGDWPLIIGAKVGYAIIPNIQIFWVADALTQRNAVAMGYLGIVTVYAALFVVAALGVAVALFQTRETG